MDYHSKNPLCMANRGYSDCTCVDFIDWVRKEKEDEIFFEADKYDKYDDEYNEDNRVVYDAAYSEETGDIGKDRGSLRMALFREEISEGGDDYDKKIYKKTPFNSLFNPIKLVTPSITTSVSTSSTSSTPATSQPAWKPIEPIQAEDILTLSGKWNKKTKVKLSSTKFLSTPFTKNYSKSNMFSILTDDHDTPVQDDTQQTTASSTSITKKPKKQIEDMDDTYMTVDSELKNFVKNFIERLEKEEEVDVDKVVEGVEAGDNESDIKKDEFDRLSIKNTGRVLTKTDEKIRIMTKEEKEENEKKEKERLEMRKRKANNKQMKFEKERIDAMNIINGKNKNKNTSEDSSTHIFVQDKDTKDTKDIKDDMVIIRASEIKEKDERTKSEKNRNSMICFSILDGSACRRENCYFAHSFDEFRPITCRNGKDCVGKCFFFHPHKENKENMFIRLGGKINKPISQPVAASDTTTSTSTSTAFAPVVIQRRPIFTIKPIKQHYISWQSKNTTDLITKLANENENPTSPVFIQAVDRVVEVAETTVEKTPKNNEKTVFCKKLADCTYYGCKFAHTLDEFNPIFCRDGDSCRNYMCYFFHKNETKIDYAVRNGINIKNLGIPRSQTSTPTSTPSQTQVQTQVHTQTHISQPRQNTYTTLSTNIKSRFCKMMKKCNYPGCNFAHNLEEYNPIPCKFDTRCNRHNECFCIHSHENKKDVARRLGYFF